jgi:ribosome-associated toxin RatA of RatAB toxin-antitoxin module
MIAAITACAALALAAQPQTWEEVDDDNGIRVWARDVAGSNIREVKAESIVNLPAERIWAALDDVRTYPEFMPYVIKGQLIGPAGPNANYEYQLIDPPFVSRRDYPLRVTVREDADKGLYTRSWVPANDKGPPATDGVVRIEVCKGAWTIEKLGSQSTRVEYYLYTDPGGNIPDWIANRANSTSVQDLVDAVRKRARNPTWKKDD